MATSLKYAQTVNASPALVFRAFTNATALREWVSDTASVDPRPGGRFFLAWNSGYYASGEFTKVLPNKEINFIWEGRDDPNSTKVKIIISSLDNGMTSFTLEHLDLQEDAEWASTLKEISEGWGKGIRNLVSILEDGPDLRMINRPMLGVTFGDFDPKKAAELNVPVSDGLCIESVVDQMGAQAAGLHRNDIIISLNGKPVRDYPTIVAILEKQQAGDKVEIGFYRGSEKKKTKMELSRRPVPDIPMTAAGLSEAIRKNNAEDMLRLTKLLETVHDTEASFYPGTEEWNIKENLAHLIHTERDNQSFIQDLVFSQERVADSMAGNLTARLRATVSAYPSLESLMAELKACQVETVSLIAYLPDEYVAVKGSFWRMGYQLLENSFHTREHESQIAAVLGSVRH